MSEKVILLEIFQPFAQYRNPFTFYYAQTYPLPPKSSIIGMLQSATNRFYDDEFWEIEVSVHGGFESVFWNYQSLIKATKTGIELVKYKNKVILFNQNFPLYSNTIQSQRSPVYQQELFNGHLYIFLKGESELINTIVEALKKPEKTLYLGRSEDVIFIKAVYENFNVEERSSGKFIRLYLPTYLKLKHKEEKFPIKKEKYPVYSIVKKSLFKNGNSIIKNKAEINTKTEREVEFETVVYTGIDYTLIIDEEIKVSIYKLHPNNKRIFKIVEGYGWI